PQVAGVDACVGGGGQPAGGALAGQEREAGDRRRHRLPQGHDQLPRGGDQERGELPGLPGGVGGGLRGTPGGAGLRQRPLPPDQGGAGVAGGQPGQSRDLLAAAVQPEPEPDRAVGGHRQRTGLANVLFTQRDDLVAAARRGLEDINGQRCRRGFVFNQDDI